jgi:mannan endo-1,4-beta-mannosidase
MNNRKIAAAATAAVISVSLLSSCGTSILGNEAIKKQTTAKTTKAPSAVTELSSDADSQTDADSTAETVEEKTIEETTYESVDVPYTEYKKTYQAESGTFTEDTDNAAEVCKDRAAFKGEGYVSGITAENWSLSFDLPESQFYNISVQTASDLAVNCTLYVNGAEVWIFRASGDSQFETKNLENIWLSEGVNEITLESTNSAADFDFITIEANEEISSYSPDLSNAALSNENASYSAKALYSLLCSNYGKQILTAQHDTAGGSEETDCVAEITGKYPAIRYSDIGGYTRDNISDVTIARRYAKKGGIIGYDWYWLDPAGSDTFEIADTDFDIKKAMPESVTVSDEANGYYTDSYPDDLTEEQQSAGSQAAALASEENEEETELKYPVDEMAMWTDEQIEYYYYIGEISDECYEILKDIDVISEKLDVLKQDGTAVLWRPLPVASNGLYWWGADEDAYKWLWQLMYIRMTDYHELDNLVWVWSAQNADWYVGDEYCDVLSVDIYTDGNRDAQINSLFFLNNISKTKPLAISECGNLPAMQSVLQEKAFWSFTALWGDSYLANEIGLTEDTEDTDETAEDKQNRFIQYYNNNYTLTRDELTSLSDLAKSIQKKEEKAAKQADSEE